jgi:hypothetical protein
MAALKISAEERRRLRRRACEQVAMYPEDPAKARLLASYIVEAVEHLHALDEQDEAADKKQRVKS